MADLSKAIAGAGILAADALLVGTAILAPELIPAGLFLSGALGAIETGLAGAGIGMLAGSIAESLTSNRGMNISTRSLAQPRQYIMGQQRVGGAIVYQSTTGAGGSGGNYIYNFVIAIANHELDGYINLYLDGRVVAWAQNGAGANIGCGSVAVPPLTVCIIAGGVITGITASGGEGFAVVLPTRYRVRIVGDGKGASAWAYNSGSYLSPVWTVTMVTGGSGYTVAHADIQGAYTFGGMAAGNVQDPTQPGYGLVDGYGTPYQIGPGGQHYTFASGGNSLVYCEARFGDQQPGDYCQELHYNDPAWPITAVGQGIAYLYVNVGANTTQFPAQPEIRITVNGKPLYDPRTDLTTFSANWALQVNDILTADPIKSFGLGDSSVNQAQLIAAANVCDELIPTSQGDEANYQQHMHWDTATSPGDILAQMMTSAAGKLSRVGGEWNIIPAYWQAPSFSFGESSLIGDVDWSDYRKQRDLVNVVNGCYLAPNYPYNVVGNYFDRNGFYYGITSNLWALSWSMTNYPQVAQDVLHGFSANQFLIEDGGITLPQELTFRGVISIVQAQRVAMIGLLRNRQQGEGSFPMSLAAWQMQPCDVMEFTWGQFGWTDKYLEVDKTQLIVQPMRNSSGDEGALSISTSVTVHETDPSVYEWNETMELLPTDQPAMPNQIPLAPAPPTSMTVESSAATAIVGADGNVFPRAEILWTAPEDSTVTEIQIQYQLVGAGAWLAGGTVDVALFQAFVGNVIAGQLYNFRIRSVRPSGATSVWVEVDNVLISITLAVIVTSGTPLGGVGTLIGYAETGGWANIVCVPFTATVGFVSVSCLPAGPYTMVGSTLSITQGQLWYVYWIDPSFLGGAITPIPTQNTADFLNKLGYYLIGSLVTPTSTGSGTVYRPTAYVTSGNTTVTAPAHCYDGIPADNTVTPGAGPGDTNSSVIYHVFPSVTLSAAATFNVKVATTASGTGCSASVQISLDGGSTWAYVFSQTGAIAAANYTYAVPSGQNLALVQVWCGVNGGVSATGTLNMSFNSLYIQ